MEGSKIGQWLKVTSDGVFELTFIKDHLNSLGIVHGGILCVFFDEIMGSLINGSAVTVNLNVDFMEPALEGTAKAVAKIDRKGKDLIFTQSEIIQGKKTIARARGTYFLVPKTFLSRK
ncbi:MAG: PaaI family thioesterase [Conexivisphaerales archaeon]